MTDGEPLKLSSSQRFNRLRADEAFYERNTFDGRQVGGLLIEILCEYDVTDAHLEALAALGDAISGTHPHMAIHVTPIPKGTTPRRLRERRKGSLAMRIADRIDMQVANGVKQDALIHELSQETGISRREIFRMLKSARQERQVLKAMEHQLADWDCWYEGFDISDDGTLVPSLRE